MAKATSWLTACLGLGVLVACGEAKSDRRTAPAPPSSGTAERAEDVGALGLAPTPADKAMLQPAQRESYMAAVSNAVARARTQCAGFESRGKRCDSTFDLAGKKFLVRLFAAGSVEPDASWSACLNFNAPGNANLDFIIMEGAGRDSTTLDLQRSSGESCDPASGGMEILGATVMNQGASKPRIVVIRNLTLLGAYRGLNRNVDNTLSPIIAEPLQEPFFTAGSVRVKWHKGVLARFPNNHAHVENVNVQGFYYGIAAEDGATAYIANTTVSDSGDAGVFAFTSAQIHAVSVTSRYAGDNQRNLGFGFVSESLNWAFSPLKDCADDACVVREATKPGIVPSVIKAWNCVAHENLAGGFLANTGAIIEAYSSKSHNHRLSYLRFAGADRPWASVPVHEAFGDREHPSVYGSMFFSGGFGFLSRHGSNIYSINSWAYENFVGFEAYADSEMYADSARAWSNVHYGFHAVKQGRINAVRAWAFSAVNAPEQNIGFAATAQDAMINVSVTKTHTPPENRFVEAFCAVPEGAAPVSASCLHIVTPVALASPRVDYNLGVYPVSQSGMVGLFYQ